MPTEKSPQAIAAEFHSVQGAYREKLRSGARHHQAFLAAVNAYSLHNPAIAKPAAAHAVTQIMRDMDELATV